MEVKVSFIFLFLSASSVLNEDEDDDGWNKQTNMCVCVCNLSKEVKRESHIFISYVCIFAYQIVTTKKGRERKKNAAYMFYFLVPLLSSVFVVWRRFIFVHTHVQRHGNSSTRPVVVVVRASAAVVRHLQEKHHGCRKRAETRDVHEHSERAERRGG